MSKGDNRAIQETFQALTSEDRRTVVRVLLNHGGTATLNEITTGVIESMPTLDRSDVEIRLHHVTLPMLAEAGIVDWDRGGTSVSLSDDTDRLPLRVLVTGSQFQTEHRDRGRADD
jgi:hypothetical protein